MWIPPENLRSVMKQPEKYKMPSEGVKILWECENFSRATLEIDQKLIMPATVGMVGLAKHLEESNKSRSVFRNRKCGKVENAAKV